MDLPKLITEADISAAGSNRLAEPITTPVQAADRLPLGGLIALAFAAAVFNLLALPLLRGADGDRVLGVLLGSFLVGALPAEVVAMASWLVWGEGTFLRRLVVHWSVACVLLLCLLAGFATATHDEWWRSESTSILCLLPVMSLALQLPLWPLRTHFGWSVERVGHYGHVERSAPLSILDILSGTAVVAVSLGLVRAVPAPGGEFLWIQLAIGAGVLVIVSLLNLFPAVIFILRFNDLRLGMGFHAAYVFLGIFIWLTPITVSTQRAPPVEIVVSILVGCISFAVTLAAPLYVLRLYGYRLVFASDGQSPFANSDSAGRLAQVPR